MLQSLFDKVAGLQVTWKTLPVGTSVIEGYFDAVTAEIGYLLNWTSNFVFVFCFSFSAFDKNSAHLVFSMVKNQADYSGLTMYKQGTPIADGLYILM